MSVKPFISFEQAHSAMKSVIDDVTKPGGMPVAVSIVDGAGIKCPMRRWTTCICMSDVTLFARLILPR